MGAYVPYIRRKLIHPSAGAIKSLCLERYLEYIIAKHPGYDDEKQGQWTLVLSKEENHVLAMAEKEKTEPAYHFTVEDPNAFMPGGSQPNVMIDTG